MKIHGSLFLWIPVGIFLLYLGIKTVPEEVLNTILMSFYALYSFINAIITVMFIFTKDIRDSTRDIYNSTKCNIKDITQLLVTIIIIPVLLIPFITYFFNDKLTIKI